MTQRGRGNGGSGGPPGNVINLEQGPVSHSEQERIQNVQITLAVIDYVQKSLQRCGDIIMTLSSGKEGTTPFEKVPNRENFLDRASKLHGKLLEKQMRLLEKSNRQLGKLEILSGKEDPVLKISEE